MKLLGLLFQLAAALWLLAFGLHHLALLLHALRATLPPMLLWFGRLPLPHNPLDWRTGWPLFIGLALGITGTALVTRAERNAQRRKGASEA